jgi:hypothetical protein
LNSAQVGGLHRRYERRRAAEGWLARLDLQKLLKSRQIRILATDRWQHREGFTKAGHRKLPGRRKYYLRGADAQVKRGLTLHCLFLMKTLGRLSRGHKDEEI